MTTLELVARLEAERLAPVPRIPRRTPAALAPITPEQAAAHRAELLAALATKGTR